MTLTLSGGRVRLIVRWDGLVDVEMVIRYLKGWDGLIGARKRGDKGKGRILLPRPERNSTVVLDDGIYMLHAITRQAKS